MRFYAIICLGTQFKKARQTKQIVSGAGRRQISLGTGFTVSR